MIKASVTATSLTLASDERLTAGRVGLPCGFTFSSEWEGLAKTVTFESDTAVTVVMAGDTLTVPPEVMLAAGYQLKIAVTGKNAVGDTVIPTIWAKAGRIETSAATGEYAESEWQPTPDLAAQVIQLAANAGDMARSVKQAADNGEFKGERGEPGEKGDPFVYSDFTPEQLEALKVKGDKGDTPTAEEIRDVFKADMDCLAAQLELKLDAETGKNLFGGTQENSILCRQGVFCDYETGTMQLNGDYCATAVPVKQGDVLSFNRPWNHVCAVKTVPNLFKANPGDVPAEYIGGFANEARQGYVVPDGCRCLIVSVPRAEIGYFQIERGDSSTGIQPYIKGLKKERVIGLRREIVVDSIGRGDYMSIQAAVDAAADGDTIYIRDGVYTEAVDAVTGGKTLHLVGESRDSTFLAYSGEDYYAPPLEIARGTVENLTIIRTSSVNANAGAYCVHIDYDELNTLQFTNVRFVNTVKPAVGIGLRANCRLSFVNCAFEAWGDAPFYCHEQQASGAQNQYVELIGCSIYRNSTGPAILLQETPAYSSSTAIIKMQGCVAANNGGGIIQMVQFGTFPGLHGTGYLGSKLWTLDPTSGVNSDPKMNANGRFD